MSTSKRELTFSLGFEPGSIGYKPKNASVWGAKEMFVDVPEDVKIAAKQLLDSGWSFYACDQKAGWCLERTKMIIIPMYVIDQNHKWYAPHKIGYKTYYIAHEMAHAYAGCKNDHNQVFMTWLKRLCPQEFLHYELEYKPRNASTAGITAPTEQWLGFKA